MNTRDMTSMEFLAAESRRDQMKREREKRTRDAAPELVDALRTILDVWDEHKIIGPMTYHDARALLARIDGKEPTA